MPISPPGTTQWRQANAPRLDALYQQVLQQTGEQGLAQDAARAAESALRDIYNQAMVNSGGNQQVALQAMEQHTPAVIRLAGLVPQITGDDPAAGATALREARQTLRQVGIEDPQFMYPWLRQNVQNDQVLRGAGLDPERVRHIESPWSHVNLDGLMGFARQMLSEYRTRDGDSLSENQISDYMDQAYAYAHRHGVGSQYVASASDNATETSNTETFTVQDLGIPRRV